MNEQVARDVVLVRAIEMIDEKRDILSDDDRKYASRSAHELAQWQAAEHQSAVTADHFLQQRSEQIIKRLGERIPAFAIFVKRRDSFKAFPVALPLIGLLLGAGLDRISDPHRVDLLSAPLLAIVGWNLLVYVAMLVWLLVPASKTGWASDSLMRRLSTGRTALPRRLPHPLTAALAKFVVEWTSLSYPLTRARLSRTVHLSAAMFGLGAVLSLYARGLLTQYVAGWESTFLHAAQVQAILSVVFAPARFVFQLPGFSVADIEALRFGPYSKPATGALWVHLYAATLFLLVIVPRLVLAAVAQWQAKRRARHFALDLDHPYFRNLGEKSLRGEPGVLRVLPYSFTVDEPRHTGLAAIAAALLGEEARLMLRPSAGYGDEPPEVLGDAALEDPASGATAVLFNLAATPEKENHGAFIEYLARRSARPVRVLVDESSLRERLGGGPEADARIAERVALWREFCRFHGAEATIVDLLHPDLKALA